MATGLMYCLTCESEQQHHNVRHHSGETLAQCRTCGTFKPFRVTKFAAPPKPRQPNPARGINPVPPSKKVQIREASKLYSDFTGHEAKDFEMVEKPEVPDVMLVVGDIDGVMYTTVRDGVEEKYVHQFKKKSKPLFCVSHDGKQLYLIGGSYDFTERGIVDRS